MAGQSDANRKRGVKGDEKEAQCDTRQASVKLSYRQELPGLAPMVLTLGSPADFRGLGVPDPGAALELPVKRAPELELSVWRSLVPAVSAVS